MVFKKTMVACGKEDRHRCSIVVTLALEQFEPTTLPEGQEVTLKQANHVPTGSHILYRTLRTLNLWVLNHLTAKFVHGTRPQIYKVRDL